MRPASAKCFVWVFAITIASSWWAAALGTTPPSSPPDVSTVRDKLGDISIPFVENTGQLDSHVRFSAPTFAGTLFVTDRGELVYALPSRPVLENTAARDIARSAAHDAPPDVDSRTAHRSKRAYGRGQEINLTERFVGGNPVPRAGMPHVTTVSSFIGDDTSRYRVGIRTFENVSLGEVFPGIDIRLRATGHNVEKIFTVRPREDSTRIALQFDGAERIAAADDGSLIVTTSKGDVSFTAPVAYQTIGGRQEPVKVAYTVDARAKRYGFSIGAYDRNQPLVIDPLLQASYVGGSNGVTSVFAVTVHPATGDIIVAGDTASTNFPQTAGSGQIGNAGGSDGFVARLNSSLTVLLQATYYGSTLDDQVTDVAVHPLSGEVLIAGTSDGTLPGMAGGFQPSRGSATGIAQGFVARLSASVSNLAQSTYVSGNSYIFGNRIAVHSVSGDIYVGGETYATDLAGTAGGARPTHSPGFGKDGFIARLNSALTSQMGATYFGGDDNSFVDALIVHPATGDIYLAGKTFAQNLPGTAGGAQPASHSSGLGLEGYVARFNATLSILRQSTYLGGSYLDGVNSIAIHPQTGDVLVAGYTTSSDFPGTAGVALPVAPLSVSSGAGFAARLNQSLTALLQSTFVTGNSATGVGSVFAHPTSGEVFLSGSTRATDLPGTGGGIQPTNAGGVDIFLSRMDSSLTAVLQSTYLGGAGDDGAGSGVGKDLQRAVLHPMSGEVIVIGAITNSTDFPGTAGGGQPVNPSGGTFGAGAVARLSADLRTEWTIAAAMSTVRSDHVLTVLQNGVVLASGGWNGSDSIAACELYNPRTNTWTPAGPLAAARSDHTATTLPTGKVLIVGGYGIGGVALAANELYNPVTNQHGPAAALTTGRYYHSATLLPNGKVLVVGGSNGGALASAELYDPIGNAWASAGVLTSARYLHTATLLPNGKVLIAGGRNGGALISTELYNPATNSWSSAGSMSVARDSHSATLLVSGNVLIAGGFGGGALASAETYNAATNVWGGPTTMKTARFSHTAALLPNGRVLVSGGYNNGGVQRASETYDGATNTWSAASPMISARDYHAAVLLPNGKVFVTGGLDGGSLAAEVYEFAAAKVGAAPNLAAARSDHSATLLPNGKVLVAGGYGSSGIAIAGSELYNPATNVWAATNPLATARFYHSATLLPNGKVLVVGGTGLGAGNYLTAAELYDPATNTWSSAGNLTTGRYLHTATLLPNGKVLIAGGRNGSSLNSAELYNPTTGTWSSAGTMPAARYWHTATLLPTNKVLLIGGLGASVLASGALYNPFTNTWGGAANLAEPRYGHTATLLPTGRVLVAGGSAAETLRTAEIYDTPGDSWSPAASLVAARDLHVAILLPNGKVLVAGGYTGGSGTAEFYDPQSGGWSGAMQIGTPRSELTATLLLNNKVLLSGGYGLNASVAASNLLDAGLVQETARQPVISTATSPLQPGTMALAATGFGFHPTYEASGAAVGSSASNTPLLQIMRADNGQTLWLPVDTTRPWTDGAFTTTAPALVGWPLGYAQVRMFVSGQPSAAFMVRTVVRGVLDIDENFAYDALTDGLMVMRYLFGLSGTAVTAGAVGSGAAVTDPIEINAYLNGIRAQLDVDGNGQTDALTDGLMIMRYLFGLRGPSVIVNAVGPGATRTTTQAIETFIQGLMP
ncbi:MAG: kelch repeat-containing protein [Betaproteobacteria bacterium]